MPPEAVVVDTSAIVEALLPRERAHGEWEQFFGRVVGAQTTLVYSALVEVELRDALFRIALKERHKGRWEAMKFDARARGRAARLMEQGRRSWAEICEQTSTAVVEVGDVADAISHYMSQHGMRSNDAVHAATAVAAQLPIATADHAFAGVPERDLPIVTDHLRAPTMRRRRSEALARRGRRTSNES